MLESVGRISESEGRQTDDGQTATVGLAIAVVGMTNGNHKLAISAESSLYSIT